MESLNRMAVELVDEAIDFAEELGVAVHNLENGATVLDFGVEVESGIEAGLLLVEIQTAGLATLGTRIDDVAGTPRTVVDLSTDSPGLALLGAQKAGWELTVDEFEALGSGPARALVAEEDEYARMGYQDTFDFGVLALESTDIPDEPVAEQVADMAGIDVTGTFLPTFATGSVAGSVAGAARAAELAVFRLSELGYDPLEIGSVSASAPLAPVSYDEATAIARVNDAVAFGGQVHLQVAEPFERFEEIPSTAGERDATFEEIYDEADWDFEELPEDLHGPAQVTVDVLGGDTHVFGETREDLLAESFGLN